MASMRAIVTAPFRILGQLVTITRFRIGQFVATPATAGKWFGWPPTTFGHVRAENSSIVVAVVRWIQRTFTEAPPIVDEWLPDREEWRHHPMDEDILNLLEMPNPYYSGATLWKATLADRIFTGTSYWLKVRSTSGAVVQLWWVPSTTITPVADKPEDFISRYEYRPGGVGGPYQLDPADVIRFPDGIDPENPRLGLSPVKTLLREIYTDEEASTMTAALLKNMGVPGVVIAPKAGTIPQEAAERVKQNFMEKTTGSRRGEPLVLEGSAEIVSYGFSPQQMELRSIRGLPEERVTAVLGINAAVLGLGAGLETTKVGATLSQYREEAFESSIIPMYRELAADLTMFLLPDFYSGNQLRNRRVAFDLSKIRVLQDDELALSKALTEQLSGGGITVSEYRRKLGYQVLPEHEVYLRPLNITIVPTRDYEPATESEDARSAPAPAPSRNGNGTTALLPV